MKLIPIKDRAREIEDIHSVSLPFPSKELQLRLDSFILGVGERRQRMNKYCPTDGNHVPGPQIFKGTFSHKGLLNLGLLAMREPVW